MKALIHNFSFSMVGPKGLVEIKKYCFEKENSSNGGVDVEYLCSWSNFLMNHSDLLHYNEYVTYCLKRYNHLLAVIFGPSKDYSSTSKSFGQLIMKYGSVYENLVEDFSEIEMFDSMVKTLLRRRQVLIGTVFLP